MKDSSDLQEILLTILLINSSLEESSEKALQQALRSSMDHLLAEALKILCKREGLSEVGMKKELVKRLSKKILNKAKEKDRVEEVSQNRKSGYSRIDTDFNFGIQEGYSDRKSETSEGNMEA
ncbi:10105_t:CDS:1 [Dentiscutata heterogama]|uniref:10105_t:CDS:1 n=1 Tax=Dentiscutata heterogama TaxID=1316150 RepID=A0ACA9M7R6_9GLOM|nr:10105_t:CDS:1 [Dentiscutata heterogama]